MPLVKLVKRSKMMVLSVVRMLALTAFVREVCMVALSGSADTSSTLGIMS
eukprot:COSAG01_NODE_13926_length_1516_cov_2050.705011_3_plen_49_part_01